MADTQSAPDNTKESDVNTTPRGVTDASAPSPEDERISELMAHSIDVPVLASALQDRQAADAADVLEDLEDADAASLLAEMDERNAADALAEASCHSARRSGSVVSSGITKRPPAD